MVGGILAEPGISDLIGTTLTSVENNADEELIFTTEEGERSKLYHDQDCCEHVRILDIAGDLQDLVGTPILKAEEVNSPEPADWQYGDDSHTWTFYHLATVKGYVTVRWLGESNGYYSESVSFTRI